MLDLKEYGIVMWDAENMPFVVPFLDWYNQRNETYRGVELKMPVILWVSEISATANTRFETVIPYYERFLDWFPTVKDFGWSCKRSYLRAWEGA